MMNKSLLLAIATPLVFAAVSIAFPHSAGALDLLVTSGKTAGPGTLREAVENNNRDGDTIYYDSSVSGTSLKDTIRIIKNNLTITGNATPQTIITKPNDALFDHSGGILFGLDGEGNGLTLKNLAFENFANVTNNPFYGAGIVGLHSDGRHDVSLGTIDNVRFAGNTVGAGNGLFGAGIIGTMSQIGQASVGDVFGVVFSKNTVGLDNDDNAETGRIWGAGLIGAASYEKTATVGDVDGTFTENSIELATYLNGGGLIGAFSVNDKASIGNVRGCFTDNTVYSADNNSGGGIIGAWTGFTGVTDASVGNITGSFQNNTVTGAASYLRGGGIVGLRSYNGTLSLGAVQGNFIENTIEVGTHLSGGGIVGLYTGNTLPGGTRNHDKSVTVDRIYETRFFGNKISVGGAGVDSASALGSVVGVTGLEQELVILDTMFKNNAMTVEATNVRGLSGTVYIGTDRATSNDAGHVLTLSASSGMTTLFQDNSIAVTEGGKTISRTSSVTFGREWDEESGKMLDSKGDARLNINAAAGGTVALYDPIAVDMNNGKAFVLAITAADNTGAIRLGGVNRLDAGGGSTFTASSGTLYLASDFSLTKESAALDGSTNGGTLNVTLDNRSGDLSMFFDLDGRDPTLAMFDNPDNFSVNNTSELSVLISSRTFSPALVDTWLVTNNRNGVDETDFSIADPAPGLEFWTEGDNLYISGIPAVAPDSVKNNANPNVLSSFLSGSLNQAWLAAKGNQSPADADALFDRIAADPQQFTAEAFASRGIAALDSAAGMWSGVRSIAGLNAPGGWQRNDANASVAGTASASLASQPQSDVAFWAGALANRPERKDRGGVYGYDGRLYGGAIGGTYVFNPTLQTGLYFAYAHDKTEFNNLGSEIKADGYQFGGFAEVRPTSRLGIRADVSHTWFDNDIKHTNAAGSYKADFDQRIFSAGLETGYDFRPGDGLTRLTPFASLRWQHLSQDRGVEKALGGAPEALASQLDSLSADSVVGSLGVEFEREIRLSCDRIVSPSVRAAWSHEFGDARISGMGGYGGIPGTYRVVSLKRFRDTLDIGAGIAARVHKSIDLTANVDASFGRRYTDVGFSVGGRIGF